MWWLLCLMLWASHPVSECQTASPTEDEFKSMLEDAAADVYAQHAEEMSKWDSPPYFKMPANFMRSFVPGTGVGNREELVINKTYPLQVFHEFDFPFMKFLYKHFNNLDYIIGISNNNVVLLKIDASTENYLLLSREYVTFHFVPNSGTVKDVVIFTRFVKYTEVLYLAILVEDTKTTVAHVYEIVGDGGVMAAVIEMKTDHSSVKKISYVQSSLGGSLVFLINSRKEEKLTYKQQGRGEQALNNYIEVNYPSAVDIVTFTVHGHGYIAVASHTTCDIFKMDELTQSHIHFSKLGPFSNIVDLEYFRLGFHHYLTVSDAEGPSLYTWKNAEFARKQKIAASNAIQTYAAAVESCRDEVVLLTVKADGYVNLHVYSGDDEIFKTLDADILAGYTVKPSSLASFTSQSRVIILYVNFTGELEAVVVETSLKPLADALLAEGERVSKIMKSIQDTLNNQKKEIEQLKEILTTAVRGSGTQHITSVQHFDDIRSTNGTVVETVNEFMLEWEDSSLTLEEYRRGTKDLEKDVEKLEEIVKEIEKEMPDVVRLDQDVVITGHKMFSGNVFVDDLLTTSLNLEYVTGMNLLQIQKDIYRLDKPHVIEGTLTFQEPLTILGNLDVERTVNGIDISEEVMTTHTEQVSNAEMHFVNELVIDGNLDIAGKLNGIDISEEVVTLNGTHRITGHMNFLNGIKARDVRTKLLDGIDFDNLYERAFTKSGNQTITADKMFSGITTNDIILKGKLNGFDVKELEENIVRIDKPTTIFGHKTFANEVTIDGELTVKGTVNGLNIPNDLFLTDEYQVITGTKEFLGHVTTRDVIVQEKVDGLKVPDDVITLSTDEEISSTLYFTDGIVAEQNIIVEGLVDGVDISEIAKQAMKLNESNEFSHAVFLGPINITGTLTVKGLVNKVDLNNLVKDIVFKDENPIVINSDKSFVKLSADKILLDHTINGYNIGVDFMKVHGDQIINGTKTFKQAVTFGSINTDNGLVGGLNLIDLYQQRISLSVDEDFETDYDIEFTDKVIVRNLTVHETVNGLKIPDDIVLRNSVQGISNKHFANKVTVDNLIVDGNINVENFGGVNLTQFYIDRITLSTEQNIPGDVILGNVSSDKMSISGLVNGININDFAVNVMSKTKSQVVTAAKEFSGNVSVHGSITSEGINGFKLLDIKRRAFKLLEDNVVTAPLEFEDNVTFSELTVSGLINGINMTRLSEDSLKKTGLQHVRGDVAFNAGFHVIGDIIATKVNGLVLSQDVLLKSVPQTITGQFTIGSVGIGGNLTVNGAVNGLDLSEIAPKLARMDSEPVIESSITFTSPIHVYENIEVTGTVNEVELKQVFDKVLTKTGDQNVTGSKTFTGNVTIEGNMDVEFVNGINWKDFLNDVVWTNIPQVIKSAKTFRSDISVDKDVFVTGLAYVNIVNGKDLKSFFDEVVYIDTPANITGPLVFKNPVEITGNMNADLINGLRLKTDVITIMCSEDGPQVITGQKTFQNVKVHGDIIADKVNSYDLEKLYEDTLLTHGNQTVTGQKFIFGDVTFKKNVYPDIVNGMILNRDLVTLDTEQKIEGNMTFKGDVFVQKDLLISGLLNGVDLLKLSQEAVYLKEDQVIEGSYSFQNVIASSNVEVNGTVNGIDLPTFDKNVTEFLKETSESLEIMDKYAKDHCELVKYLQESLQNSYYALDSLTVHQNLQFPATFIRVKSEQVSFVYLNDMGTMATLVHGKWNSNTTNLSFSSSTKTGIIKSFTYSIGGLNVIVNIGINIKDSSVAVEGFPSKVQSGFTDVSVVRKRNAAIAFLYPLKGICEIHTVNEKSLSVEKILDVGKEATSIVMFEISNSLYLAVSSSRSPPYIKGSSKIYGRANGDWQMIQNVGTLSSSLVKHFEYHGYHYLAFTEDAPVYETKEAKSIRIYRNSGPHDEFSLFQKVPFDGAIGLETFTFGDLSQLHLIAWNETIVQVFSLEGESGMTSLFTIHGKCIKDVKPFLIGNDFYVIVGQQNLKTDDVVQSVLYKGLTKGIKYESYNLTYC